MQSISKRELFIEAFNVYKENASFLINIGFLIFTIQIIFPSLFSSLLGGNATVYILYQIAYTILSTGVSLGIIVQLIRIIRGGAPGNISCVFNYFHKVPANLLGSFIVISSIVCATLLFSMAILDSDIYKEIATGISSGVNLDFKMIFGENLPPILVGALIVFGIMVVYLSIKTHFFVYFIMDKNMGPLVALKESFLSTNGLEAELFIVWSLMACLNLMGAVLYMLGLLFTLPFTMIVISLIYNKYLCK